MDRAHMICLALLMVVACAPPARSPECNAIVNRCMESCANEPETTKPREQAVATGNTTSVAQTPCEQRCASKCR